PTQGIPTFGLDALSSAAYGPEAALTILLPLGLLGVRYIVPLTFAVIALLVIVFFSYRQTIAAYPNGGGSYTVARENLGAGAGLLAGAALMIDYLLNVAVGISAGIGALVSAVPSLLPHTLVLCLLVLAILTMVNLRGVKEAGTAFIAPTYLFVGRTSAGRHFAGPTANGPDPNRATGRRLDSGQGLRLRMHRLNRSRGRKQRSASLQKAGSSRRSRHLNCHHRHFNFPARWNRRPRTLLRNHGNRPRRPRIPEYLVPVDR